MNNIILNLNTKIEPSKVVCIGRNYVEHVKELNNKIPSQMVFFIKPNSSISQKLFFPTDETSCHYEAEISFLIKNNQIIAVGFGLDLTLREKQNRLKKAGLPWERAKAFRNSAVFSEFVSFNGNIDELQIQLYINDKLKQKGDVSMMINKPLDIIKEANTFLDFEDWDILMTGTPKGVGSFNKNDIFVGKIYYQNNLLLEKKFKVLNSKKNR